MALTVRNLLQIDSLACACYAVKFLAFPEWYLDNTALVKDNAVRILRMWGLGVQPGLAAFKWIVSQSTDEDTIQKVGMLSTVWSLLGAASFYFLMPYTPLTLANLGMYGVMAALYGYASFLAPRQVKKI